MGVNVNRTTPSTDNFWTVVTVILTIAQNRLIECVQTNLTLFRLHVFNFGAYGPAALQWLRASCTVAT